MEDENGLELSLGLSCVDPLSNQKQLPKAAVEADASMNLNGRGLWAANNNRSPEVEEEKRPELDVAESEVDVSTSRLASHPDDGSKRFVGAGGSSEVAKERNLAYCVPFPVQSVNINVPYSLHAKESNPVGAPGTSGYSLPGMMQVMPPANNERAGIQPVNTGNLPLMFGYSPVQLPMLDKNNSWGVASHSQQFHPPYAGKGPPNSDKHNDGLKISQAAVQAIPHNSPEASHYDGRALELTKGDGKQHPTEEAPLVKQKMISAIRPGIAADMKFGGSGSHPNLPWVSTTGSNGKTISGVTYRYSRDQIRIVCACHGSHMSPEEFVQHASEEHANPETGTGLAPFPSSNPATSAQS
ncbi:Ninja-family protein mc410 [Vitis vinifera]|uniref:Ninja-family protein n=1 Tax=Vitis vinifera TaxID=29760 RepID=A0A438DSD0_VITVI|nr:Ninja-family protein mc410 [Vitis vinifera]